LGEPTEKMGALCVESDLVVCYLARRAVDVDLEVRGRVAALETIGKVARASDARARAALEEVLAREEVLAIQVVLYLGAELSPSAAVGARVAEGVARPCTGAPLGRMAPLPGEGWAHCLVEERCKDAYTARSLRCAVSGEILWRCDCDGAQTYREMTRGAVRLDASAAIVSTAEAALSRVGRSGMVRTMMPVLKGTRGSHAGDGVSAEARAAQVQAARLLGLRATTAEESGEARAALDACLASMTGGDSSWDPNRWALQAECVRSLARLASVDSARTADTNGAGLASPSAASSLSAARSLLANDPTARARAVYALLPVLRGSGASRDSSAGDAARDVHDAAALVAGRLVDSDARVRAAAREVLGRGLTPGILGRAGGLEALLAQGGASVIHASGPPPGPRRPVRRSSIRQ